MTDTADFWNDIKEARKQEEWKYLSSKKGRRMLKKQKDEKEIFEQSLIAEGMSFRWLTPYQLRINECFDIYPRNGRYHDIRTNERGDVPPELLKF